MGSTPASPLYAKRKRTLGIVLHSSHTGELENVTPLLHTRGRAMGLLEPGYHYVIERDGRAYVLRDEDSIGAHLRGFNHEWIGVCIAGGKPTLAQIDALDDLYADVCHQEGRKLALAGHHELTRPRKPQHPCPEFDMNLVREELEAPKTVDPYVLPNRLVASRKLSQQHHLILDHLRKGRALSNLIAITSYGIGSLSSRIAELRDMGYNIVSETDTETDATGKRFVKYRLLSEDVAEG